MEEKFQKIYQAFDGKLVGSKQMKQYICEVVALLPQDISNFVTKNCWFIASMEDAWAFAFTGNDLKDHHLIFLSEDLFREDIAQIQYSIAHEIGHVILKHRNSVLVRQTKEEIARQEKEADEFARKYIH